jgi:ABC-type transport system involved in multi-copper enzyme maturation permease subunit
MAVTVVALTATDLAVGWFNYHQIMWRLVEGGLAVWLESGVLAAFAIALSTLTGPVPVAVASLGFLFVGHLGGGPAEQAGALTVSRFAPTLETFNIVNPVAHGTGVSVGYDVLMAVVAAAWVGLLLVLASVSFGLRDL